MRGAVPLRDPARLALVANARVLIVEDEPSLADVLTENLQEEGYQVEVATDGLDGLERWRRLAPDVVVLDVMLPHLDGFELCRARRAAGDATPVLFLSARGQPGERVTGLEAGGDDYLTKPFHLPEFLLRVKGLLRRSQPAPLAELRFAGHVVDFRRWTARLADGRHEQLGERELGILKLLAERQGAVVSRDDIMDEVWGDDTFPSTRTIDNFIVRLRRLFEPDPSSPVHFHTVWGVGYRFTPEPPDDQAEPVEVSA
ncbi:MAG TPA: response regulator transcription factor [Trueperaceae bacterium]|nr:response regulator transcription factor [Trueperaceae bacterium]